MGFIKNKFMKLDFFGAQFQFSIMGNSKYRSPVGLIMSSICLVMIIIVTILFGNDFYNKENPKLLQRV